MYKYFYASEAGVYWRYSLTGIDYTYDGNWKPCDDDSNMEDILMLIALGECEQIESDPWGLLCDDH